MTEYLQAAHVIPVGDEMVHFAHPACPCKPTLQNDGVAVHNAEDCREYAEVATGGEKCSEGWMIVMELFIEGQDGR
jgi:hypothetical protein